MCSVVTSKGFRSICLSLLSLAAVQAAGSVAQAAPITYSFTADVTLVSGGLAPDFDATQSITGSFTYESTTPFRMPAGPFPSEQSTFDALTNFEFSIDGYNASSTGAPEIQLDDFGPNVGVADRFALISRATDGLTGPPAGPGNLALESFGMVIFYSNNGNITDASMLPTTIPFTFGSDFTLLIIGFENGEQVIAELTGLQLQQADTEVPEPASLAIFLVAGTVTGSAGFMGRWRRRRVRAER